jgi:hypothetical protein
MKYIYKCLIIIIILSGCSEKFTDKTEAREILEESLSLGTDFLINNQKPEGNFNYEYNFVEKTQNNSDSQVRQAGALWGVSLIFNNNPEEKTFNCFLKAYDFFMRNSKETEYMKWVVYPGENSGRTGTTALVALSIIEILRTDNNFINNDMRNKLGTDLDKYINLLVSLIREDGLFYMNYSHEDGKGYGDSSPYFDGESLLALVKAAKYLARNDLIPVILESAQSMYKKNIEEALEADPDSKTTKGFFQWSSMAYFEIETSGIDTELDFGEIVLELSDWMIDVHKTLKRTRNTAYAYEGIIHAYEIARMRGDKEHMEKFYNTICEGMYKLTSWQVDGPVQNSYLKNNPSDDIYAAGGIMNHRKEPFLRIDVTQHQMHAVILALRYVYN